MTDKKHPMSWLYQMMHSFKLIPDEKRDHEYEAFWNLGEPGWGL